MIKDAKPSCILYLELNSSFIGTPGKTSKIVLGKVHPHNVYLHTISRHHMRRPTSGPLAVRNPQRNKALHVAPVYHNKRLNYFHCVHFLIKSNKSLEFHCCSTIILFTSFCMDYGSRSFPSMFSYYMKLRISYHMQDIH